MTETEKAALDAIVKLLRDIDAAGKLAAEARAELATDAALIVDAVNRIQSDTGVLAEQQAAVAAATASAQAKLEALIEGSDEDEDGEDEDGEDDGEPEPPSDVLFEWRDLTAPVELPAGAARDATYIYGVVKTDPPDGKYRKPFGADASEGRYAGLCVGINNKGQFEAWVDDGGGIRQVLLGLTPRKRSFFAVRIASDALTAWVDDKVAAVTLPNGRKPCDGVAAAGKGVWNHVFVDPAFPGVALPLLRVCRALPTDAEVRVDRSLLADLVDPEPDVPPAPGPDPTPDPPPGPPPPDGLEPVNNKAVQVELVAAATEEQAFHGFGLGMGSAANAIAGAPLAAKWPERLFEELRTTWLQGYSASRDYKAFATLGQAHGVKHLLCTGGLWRAGISAAAFADQIKAAIESGLLWDFCTPANEPDGSTLNRWSGYPGNLGVVVDAFRDLRKRLDAIGLGGVKIVANGYAHFGGAVDNEFDALDAAGLIPRTVIAGNGHCYHDCPHWANNWVNRWRKRMGADRFGLVSSETGYGSPINGPARYLAALNNGASVHFWHQSQASATSTDALAQCVVDKGGARRPWHGPHRIINETLTLGSVFRHVTSSDRPAGLAPIVAEHMMRGYGSRNPRLEAAVAKRPDGKWVVLATNATEGSDTFNSYLSAHYGAATLQASLRIAGLAGKNGSLVGTRTSSNGTIKGAESFALVDGWTRFTLAAGETIALVGG